MQQGQQLHLFHSDPLHTKTLRISVLAQAAAPPSTEHRCECGKGLIRISLGLFGFGFSGMVAVVVVVVFISVSFLVILLWRAAVIATCLLSFTISGLSGLSGISGISLGPALISSFNGNTMLEILAKSGGGGGGRVGL